jgi:hypothetical protein
MKTKMFMLAISLIFIVGCKSTDISGNYTYEIECMGSELDGSITLKAWGKGNNRADAIEQAKKNAVNAVLFIGIRNGKPECDTRQILNVPNIREKKADYFNNFFKDGGDYKKFTSNKDQSIGNKDKALAEKGIGRDGEVMYGLIIRVMRSELKKQMITDGILNN